MCLATENYGASSLNFEVVIDILFVEKMVGVDFNHHVLSCKY